jgi:hypothetical protein
MLIALITVPFVGRFRLVLLPDRASLPPPTFDTTAESVEPAQGPGLARCLPSNVVPLRAGRAA